MNETLPVFEIRVQGYLAPRRLSYFEDLMITHQPNGETVLVGPVQDQPALHGLLNWLQCIGVPLLSVRRLEKSGPTEEDGNDRSDQ